MLMTEEPKVPETVPGIRKELEKLSRMLEKAWQEHRPRPFIRRIEHRIAALQEILDLKQKSMY